MRLKLDENLDLRLAPMLAEEGHEVETVYGEEMSGAADERIYEACIREGRTLITLDLDFSNPFRFPPEPTEGIVVVRPARPTLPMIRATLLSALPELESRSLDGALWIVEPGRVRVYDVRADEGGA